MTLEQNNELQIILHQIRDAEFEMRINYSTQNAIIMSPKIVDESLQKKLSETITEQSLNLKSLRNKRDTLLNQQP